MELIELPRVGYTVFLIVVNGAAAPSRRRMSDMQPPGEPLGRPRAEARRPSSGTPIAKRGRR
ncbi:hypothetical protein BRAO285_220075 [Bradyrhizobium sp. ORS 285]|nr:hypothetical protein BRAO285_220075 [Bradyrhizobium sp. ORS 285]